MDKRNYQNGQIYCIKNFKSDDIYVGSTTQTLCKRMENHRASMKMEKKNKAPLYQKMIEIGIEQFYIDRLEKCKCNDIEELRAREREWIKKIGNLNIRIEGRTAEEYYIDNKEHINKTNNDNYYKNRDRILAQQKEYNSTHKEEKREYDKQRREDKREEISNKQKEKYENNKEHYKEKSRNSYNEKKK